MIFKIPVKVSDERVVVRASVTTADTVADRAATSIDTVPELELDVASLAGSVGNGHRHRRGRAPFCSRSGTCRSLSGGMLARRYLLYRIELVVKYGKYKQTTMRYVGPLK